MLNRRQFQVFPGLAATFEIRFVLRMWLIMQTKWVNKQRTLAKRLAWKLAGVISEETPPVQHYSVLITWTMAGYKLCALLISWCRRPYRPTNVVGQPSLLHWDSKGAYTFDRLRYLRPLCIQILSIWHHTGMLQIDTKCLYGSISFIKKLSCCWCVKHVRPDTRLPLHHKYRKVLLSRQYPASHYDDQLWESSHTVTIVLETVVCVLYMLWPLENT